MRIGVTKESKPGENRVALSPDVVGQLVKAGYEIIIETKAGEAAGFPDSQYQAAGAQIAPTDKDVLSAADTIAKVNAPTEAEANALKEGSTLISFLYANSIPSVIDILTQHKVSAISMDAIPRISRAQNMDALSSQANLAGYKAVIVGANALPAIFPLLMTAAGTVKPSRVLIYGAGVAGLQAIATAKRLGAVVEVTDVRPETKEQVESLGGKFIEVVSTDEVKVEGGYAKEVSADYLQKQKEAVNASLVKADLVITTALVMGKKAPVLITAEQVATMKPGSVIVDMAVEQGGNCELSKLNETVRSNGVSIIGQANLPGSVARNASELYAKNIFNLLGLMATKDGFNWDLTDEITDGSLITHQGQKRK